MTALLAFSVNDHLPSDEASTGFFFVGRWRSPAGFLWYLGAVIHPCCRLLFALPCSLFLMACDSSGDTASGGSGGSGGGGGQGAGPPVLTTVFGSPSAVADPPGETAFSFDGYASAAATRQGLTVVGTTVGVYSASPEGVIWLPLVGDEPDLPPETGIVKAAAPIEQGVLVAAETGLFVADGGVLTRSNGHMALFPFGISKMASRIADEDEDGTPEAHLTLVTDEGLVTWQKGEIVTWKVGGESGAPSAAVSRRDRMFVAWQDRVYEVDPASEVGYPLVFSIGSVREIACASVTCDAGAAVYFATDLGLVERSPGGEYKLYTLAPEGEPGVAVSTFALDAGKQRLYAVTDRALLRVRGGGIPDEIANLGEAPLPRSAAADKSGDVWTFTGGEAVRLGTGTPLSFATDIQPIMGEYCAPCHKESKNGAPKIDFENYDKMVEYADKVLKRVQDGSMPPPNWPQIPAEQVQLLVDWVAIKSP